MASLESVRQKHNRARSHFDEYNRELTAYYQSNPGEMVLQPESTSQHHNLTFKESQPIPAKFGLIAGDCLQCLRTCLDYLIWDLVSSAGNEPTRHNMFPIALTESAFKDDVKKRHRLDGVDPAAIAVIESLQPYHLPEDQRERSPLAVVDELANINKHRRILLTAFGAQVMEEEALSFPAIRVAFSVGPQPDQMSVQARMAYFIVFQDGALKNIEVSSGLSRLASFFAKDVFPKFKGFFG
jgi:hypothetical protein